MIARGGKPSAQLVPISSHKKGLKPPGAMRDQFSKSDDIDPPLDRLFDGRLKPSGRKEQRAGCCWTPTCLVTELQKDLHSVLISQASLWEMAIEVNLGRLRVDVTNLEQHGQAVSFQCLAISNEHLLEVARLETIEVHRDPFDPLLVAQSRVEPSLLFT